MAYSKINCPNERTNPRTGHTVSTIHRVNRVSRQPNRHRCLRCGDYLFRVHLRGRSLFYGHYIIEEEDF